MKESDIKHENGGFWVCRDKRGYSVMQTGTTHSVSICTFAGDADGLSLAIAYCDYQAKRAAKG